MKKDYKSNMELLKKQILGVTLKHISRNKCIIFLFGSFAQNKVYPSSDLDIGLIADKPLKNSILVKIKEELQQLKTLRDIDVVDFLAVEDKNFLRIALQEVKIWHQTKNSRIYLSNLKKRIGA